MPIETYSQEDVKQLARVFTGFRLASTGPATPDAMREPLVIDPAANEAGPSTFMGWTVSGGGMAAVEAALDVVFNHANLPPFFARALIQRLVTSNRLPVMSGALPTPFCNNGHGVRGDLRAVVYAILTDPEARSDLALAAPHAGKLRDPIQRLTHWARAFGAHSARGRWDIGDMSSASKGLGQSPGVAPPTSSAEAIRLPTRSWRCAAWLRPSSRSPTSKRSSAKSTPCRRRSATALPAETWWRTTRPRSPLRAIPRP